MQHFTQFFFWGENFCQKADEIFYPWYMLEEVGHNMSLVMWLTFVSHTLMWTTQDDVNVPPGVLNVLGCLIFCAWNSRFTYVWMGQNDMKTSPFFVVFIQARDILSRKKKISRYPQPTELDWYSYWALQLRFMPGRAMQSLQMYFEQIG